MKKSRSIKMTPLFKQLVVRFCHEVLSNTDEKVVREILDEEFHNN